MKKSAKQNDPLVEEVRKLTEAVNLLRDRTRNDSFMLTQNSQEVQIMRSELTHMTNMVKHVSRNPIVKFTDYVSSFLGRHGSAIELLMIVSLVVIAFMLGRKL